MVDGVKIKHHSRAHYKPIINVTVFFFHFNCDRMKNETFRSDHYISGVVVYSTSQG